MGRPPAVVRTLWRITALLQLVLPALVSVADARLERDAVSARAYSHVESKTTKDCARTHQADCALCQHLSAPIAKAAKPTLLVQIARREAPSSALAIAIVTARAERPSLPRAPPAA